MTGMTCAGGLNLAPDRLWHFVPKPISQRMDSIGLVGSLLAGGNYTLMKIFTTSLNRRTTDRTLSAGGNFTFACINGIYAVPNNDASNTLPITFNFIMAPNCDASYTGIPCTTSNYAHFSSSATAITINSDGIDEIADGSICTVAFFK